MYHRRIVEGSCPDNKSIITGYYRILLWISPFICQIILYIANLNRLNWAGEKLMLVFYLFHIAYKYY